MPSRQPAAYLLDTNVCIALINGTPASVRNHLERNLKHGSSAYISSISAFELWYGVEKSTRQQSNAMRLNTFFSGPVQILPFGVEDAQVAGKIRAVLERAGKPIGAYDPLLAAQALVRNYTLVTANVQEFSRIEGLVWEDWAKR